VVPPFRLTGPRGAWCSTAPCGRTTSHLQRRRLRETAGPTTMRGDHVALAGRTCSAGPWSPAPAWTPSTSTSPPKQRRPVSTVRASESWSAHRKPQLLRERVVGDLLQGDGERRTIIVTVRQWQTHSSTWPYENRWGHRVILLMRPMSHGGPSTAAMSVRDASQCNGPSLRSPRTRPSSPALSRRGACQPI
jgi:hypothetical protein